MTRVGVLEAKTHLSGLVEAVETRGEEVVITRHGRPVAKIVAMDPPPLSAAGDLLVQAKAIRARIEARGAPEEPIDVVAWVREDRESR